MANIMMKPIINLKIGDKISPRFKIEVLRVQNWEYSNECPSRFSPVLVESQLEIFEKDATPGKAWVKAYLPKIRTIQ